MTNGTARTGFMDRFRRLICHIVVRIFRNTLSMASWSARVATFQSKRVGLGGGDGAAVKKTSKARLIFTDFAASLVMAISIGLATSITLAGAVLLIAQHSASESQPAASSPADGSS